MLFVVMLGISLISYRIGKRAYPENRERPYLLASGLAMGNAGYFGIPVAAALLDPDTLALYLLAAFSNLIFQVTFSYYYMALGTLDWKAASLRLLKLPPIYGAIAGLLLSLLDIPVPNVAAVFLDIFKSGFVILGMMIIGFAVSDLRGFKIDFKFLSISMLIRFVVWPVLVFAIIIIDKSFLGLSSDDLVKVLLIFSLLPIAANFVTYATHMNLFPEKASTVVVASTLISAVLIPLGLIAMEL